MKKTKNNNMLIHGFILVTILATAKSAEAEITMEAAFQGHCGHTSPCEQLCYEIHDGMYECDCIEGYELNKNGYSCQVINTTANGDVHSKSDEDVLYQKGASFSAKLANDDENDSDLGLNEANENQLVDTNQLQSQQTLQLETRANNPANMAIISTSSLSGSEEDTDIIDSASYDEINQQQQRNENRATEQKSASMNSQDYKVSSNDYYISDEDSLNLDSFKISGAAVAGLNESLNSAGETKATPTKSNPKEAAQNYSDPKSKMSKPFKVVLNGKLKTLRTKTLSPSTATQKAKDEATSKVQVYRENPTPEIDTSVAAWNSDDDYYAKHEDMSVYDDVNNNQLNLHPINENAYSAKYSPLKAEPSSMPDTTTYANHMNSNQGRNINENKLANTSASLADSESCNLDCGPDGICDMADGTAHCLCAFGKTGTNCLEETKISVPKFSKNSWIAFPALRGAYKHVQIKIEFRPESFDGVMLLSGERDDLTGDFIALLLNKGFVEFWFDCGSGVGHVRSKETVLLNEWNTIVIYRHRWDAWLVLNHGSKVQGRSNGLFSRITFREPVFLGGTGNITGLIKRIPVSSGFEGCIRSLVANEHQYKFEEHPKGDVSKGFAIQDCVTDKCYRYPCKHGGKCLPSEEGAVCLCPIGFVGDLCETRMDLQVPAFNGSSYLKYAPLGEKALIWLEMKIIIKPEQLDGIIMYSGPKTDGDFIALTLTNGYVEFVFDLGSGPAVVRSESPLTNGQWHIIKISRTARLAVLKIDDMPEVMTISSNGFWHLSLPHNLFVGGVSHVDKLPLDLTYKAFFVGCIQKIEINGHSLAIVSEALGGTNIGNCPHACMARPCGPLAECEPQMESYECRCNKAYNTQCNKVTKVSSDEFNINNKQALDNNNNNRALQQNQQLQQQFEPQNENQDLQYNQRQQKANQEQKPYYQHNRNQNVPFHSHTQQHHQEQQQQPEMEQSRKMKLKQKQKQMEKKPQYYGTAGSELKKNNKKIQKYSLQKHQHQQHERQKQQKHFLYNKVAAKTAGRATETVNETPVSLPSTLPHQSHARFSGLEKGHILDKAHTQAQAHSYVPSNNQEKQEKQSNYQHHLHRAHHHDTEHNYAKKDENAPISQSSVVATTRIPLTTTTEVQNVFPTLSAEEEQKIDEMLRKDEIEDDIIFEDIHEMHRKYGKLHNIEATKSKTSSEEDYERFQEMIETNRESGPAPHVEIPDQSQELINFPDVPVPIKAAALKPSFPKISYSFKMATQKPYHEKYPIIGHKLSRLPTHYESFQTNPDSDILTFDENIDWETQLAAESVEEPDHEQQQVVQAENLETFKPPSKPDPLNFDGSLFDEGTEEYQRKQLTQDMERIMTNEHEHIPPKKFRDEFEDYDYKSVDLNDQMDNGENKKPNDLVESASTTTRTPIMPLDLEDKTYPHPVGTSPQTQTDWSLLKKFDLDSTHIRPIGVKKSFGACFSGTDSYFHYSDAETMSRVISCNIDVNMRIKTHSENGVLLWTGRQSASNDDDDYLSLGLEDGYLHFRYNLGSGQADIIYNKTKLSDGLWHRIRAIRNSQEGFIEVDGRKTVVLQSPGKLRQLNTDTGLYVGGMPDVSYFTKRRYKNGVVGCISEIIVGGDLKLNFDPNTLGTSHNVETGIL